MHANRFAGWISKKEEGGSTSPRGFSLTEVLVAILIVLTLVAASAPMINSSMRNMRISQAEQAVMMSMRYARQIAMDERRNIRVTFSNPTASLPAQTIISRMDTSYNVVSTVVRVNLPSTMGFWMIGSPAAPESNSTVLDTSKVVDYRPDGAAADSTGQYINGVVYVSDHTDAASMRAVSLFGTTGRVKSYKFKKDSSTWIAE